MMTMISPVSLHERYRREAYSEGVGGGRRGVMERENTGRGKEGDTGGGNIQG